jgi:hypothetical protein
MPCDTIQRSSISLELKADNKTFLIAALKALGYTVSESGEVVRFVVRENYETLTGSFINGKLRLEGDTSTVNRFNVNAVKRAYSFQVVQSQAKKHGWTLKQTKDNKFVVQKRGM